MIIMSPYDCHWNEQTKKEKAMTSKITVVIEKDEDGYYAYAPELPGCQTQGDTLDEVLANIQEAVELYLSTLSLADFNR